MKINVCISILLFLFSFSIKGQTAKSRLILLKGKPIIFYQTDKYYQQQLFTISKAGQFKEINNTHPVLYYSALEGGFPIIIYPGEEVLITNINNRQEAIVKNNERRTNDLRLMKELVLSKDNYGGMESEYEIPILNPDFKKNDSAYFRRFKKHLIAPPKTNEIRDSLLYLSFQRRLAFIEKFRQQYPITDSFYEYFRQYFLYRYLRVSLLGPYRFKDQQGLPTKLAQVLEEKKETLINDSLLNIDSYRFFISIYNSYLNIEKYGNVNNTLPALQTSLMEFKAGLSRDYIMYIFTASAKRKPGFDSAYAFFLQHCADKDFRDRLIEEVNFSKAIPANGIAVMDRKNRQISFDSLTRLYKGKLIYIDLWASWCMPCLAEMPNSAQLQKKYAGKDMVFLYLSMDKSKSPWETAMKDYPTLMTAANSYLLLNNFESPLAKKYNISSIPRYMLIGKTGKLLSSDAPRPGEEALRKMIEENIK
jgi:thiol-disulfide isomerase/thioredoxin